MALDRLLRATSVLLFTCFIATIPLFAQKITGDISGTVTDASGAAVSGALIRAENIGTGEKQSATANDTGFYRIVNLNPGQYRLTVEASGFKTTSLQASVDIALVTQANFSLQIGSKTETVEVQESPRWSNQPKTASAPSSFSAKYRTSPITAATSIISSTESPAFSAAPGAVSKA